MHPLTQHVMAALAGSRGQVGPRIIPGSAASFTPSTRLPKIAGRPSTGWKPSGSTVVSAFMPDRETGPGARWGHTYRAARRQDAKSIRKHPALAA